ncbi:PQQ-dependent sugar dehydrogenase [Uliginosibacterium sp. H3]|uniref:PQQ-dependent sugar dehydrogenase n=1 Tax=Uliginosibacterium silvisoli TaxID=3114758 RepID=A0ABU6K0Q7_9RHOO|nr:PQQ-dependent sugar dehydrogenase [Uliginosibacterium sp. H3]
MRSSSHAQHPLDFLVPGQILVLMALSACATAADGPAARCDANAISGPATSITPVASGLVNPWGLAFLPDGRMLVTEREGRMRIVSINGTTAGTISTPVSGVPAVHAAGQGGLLDVVLDPAFASNGRIYFAYSEAGPGGSGTAVARAVLDPQALSLSAVTPIYRQTPKVSGNGHYGARLAFGTDGKLYVSLGERQKFDPAQDTQQSLGKILRLNTDGSVPADNPFAGNKAYLPEIWSYGHRNPQGMTRHPVTGQLWTAEHGARGGDEINTPEAGKNYGWPVISYGVNYSGTKIGEGAVKAGMEQPRCYWDPSIAPGNLVFYTGGKLPAWSGNLFVTALKDTALMRLSVDGNRITGQQRIEVGKRVRDVRVGPDGWLYLLTDEAAGQILRVSVP